MNALAIIFIVSLWLLAAIIGFWRSKEPTCKIPREVLARAVEIICSECSGDDWPPKRTEVTKHGQCSQCGGTSYILASKMYQPGAPGYGGYNVPTKKPPISSVKMISHPRAETGDMVPIGTCVICSGMTAYLFEWTYKGPDRSKITEQFPACSALHATRHGEKLQGQYEQPSSSDSDQGIDRPRIN
jgi:hypothetical protein